MEDHVSGHSTTLLEDQNLSKLVCLNIFVCHKARPIHPKCQNCQNHNFVQKRVSGPETCHFQSAQNKVKVAWQDSLCFGDTQTSLIFKFELVLTSHASETKCLKNRVSRQFFTHLKVQILSKLICLYIFVTYRARPT